MSVFLFVSLFTRLLKNYEHTLIKCFGGVRRGPRNNHLYFGGNPYHDPDLRFIVRVKELFKPPPPVGAGGGYMFSGRPSVRASVRPSVRP